ncbi:hypothetical protein VNI00_018826 [Paramarasmius palmivorus]|uniref:Uncharacterized protein n=1 Tax=Paramarasmius palmivorus TaxID=297713 RepID=A0AAW0AUV5_9AGAR
MARQRLYHTRQEKIQANRRKSLRSYHKNKEAIAERKRQKSDSLVYTSYPTNILIVQHSRRLEEAQARAEHVKRLDELEERAKERSRSTRKKKPQRKPTIEKLNESKEESAEELKKLLIDKWTQRAEKTQAKLQVIYLKSSGLNIYCDLLYNRYLVSIREGTSGDILEEHRSKLEFWRGRLSHYKIRVHQEFGIGEMYDRFDFMEREAMSSTATTKIESPRKPPLWSRFHQGFQPLAPYQQGQAAPPTKTSPSKSPRLKKSPSKTPNKSTLLQRKHTTPVRLQRIAKAKQAKVQARARQSRAQRHLARPSRASARLQQRDGRLKLAMERVFQRSTPLATRVIYDSLDCQHVAVIAKVYPTVFYPDLWNGNITLGVLKVVDYLERSCPEVILPSTGDEILDSRLAFRRRDEVRRILVHLGRLWFFVGHRDMALVMNAHQCFTEQEYDTAADDSDDDADVRYMDKTAALVHVETRMPARLQEAARVAIVADEPFKLFFSPKPSMSLSKSERRQIQHSLARFSRAQRVFLSDIQVEYDRRMDSEGGVRMMPFLSEVAYYWLQRWPSKRWVITTNPNDRFSMFYMEYLRQRIHAGLNLDPFSRPRAPPPSPAAPAQVTDNQLDR